MANRGRAPELEKRQQRMTKTRARVQWQEGFAIWITGLPGSGKSVVSNALKEILDNHRIRSQILRTDELRGIMTPKPKYTSDERTIVYRSLVIMAQLLVERGGKSVIIDATGNRKEFRELARRLIREFAEIYVKCPLKTCQARETSRRGQPVQKHLYESAAEGTLKGKLPGISAPYEEPENPEVLVASDVMSSYESAKKIMAYIRLRWTG